MSQNKTTNITHVPEAVSEAVSQIIDLAMLLQYALGSCFDGRDVQRVLTGAQFQKYGVNPNAVDGVADKGVAVRQAKAEIARAISAAQQGPHHTQPGGYACQQQTDTDGE